MGLIEDIKLLHSVNVATTQIKEAYAANTTASGHSWFSSRFWLTVVSVATTFWGAAHGFIPQPYESVIQISGVAVYVIAETIRKAVIDVQAAKATPSAKP